MTAVILDTHALVWALTAPARLGPTARDLVSDPAVSLHVSAASAWEISTKHRIGTMPGVEALLGGWDRQIERLGARELVVTAAHARLAGALEWDHRDPFDRVLVAQAGLESLPLVSRDPHITSYPSVTVIW